MSRNQRITFLAIAAVFAVVAVLILVSQGGDDDEPSRAATTAATATTTAPATTTATTPGATAAEEEAEEPTEPAEPAEPEPTVLERGEEGRIEVSKGDQVRFVVRSDVADEVHLHGYDIAKDVAAGGEVTFSFKADITGIFEIELENAGEPLGKLVVNP